MKNKFPEQLKKLWMKYSGRLNRTNLNKNIIIAGSMVFVLLVSVFLYYQNEAYAVKVDGRVIGVVREKEDFTTVFETLRTNLHSTYQRELVLNQKVTFEKTRAQKEEITESRQLQSSLEKMLYFKVMAYGIKVNDKVVGILSTKEQAEQILAEIKTLYTNQEDKKYEGVEFAEKVVVEEVAAVFEEIENKAEVLKRIQQGTDEVKIHEVKEGETLWSIAKIYKITMDDLIKANPEINPDKIKLKQKINLVVAKPLVTVATIERTRYKTPIPFEIKFEETSALYKGETKIKIQGKEGVKEIYAEVTRHNGLEIGRTVLEEKVLEQSKTQIVLKGTKVAPVKKATGKFSNPSRGRLTSRFGWRWGKNHDGIDIANKTGTPIYAADGGKVTFSGRNGSYGNLVIIDHGNRTQTYYAHNSKNYVSVGQKVHKGEKIAAVGNTGRSTGPHVHFEIRVNGKPVNPLKYVKY